MTLSSAAKTRAKISTFLTAVDGPRLESSVPKNPTSSAEFWRASTAAGKASPAISETTWSNSRADSLSRESRRDCDVRSAGVDLNGFQPLPSVIELSSVTERVLREAPFACGDSKPIWRAFLSSAPFKELATDGFWFVIAHEILGEPVDPSRSPRFSRMAHVYSHMFTQTPPVFKDLWGSRFFEAWALTLLLLLQECYPKSKAVFDDPSFRMRLLDFCAECTLGLRPSFPLTGHWIIKFDKRPPSELERLKRRMFGMGLSASASSPTTLISVGGMKKGDRAVLSGRGARIPRHKLDYVPSRSLIEFGNSPLVQEHLGVLSGSERAAVIPLRLQITREATRTLRPFQELAPRLSNAKTTRANSWRAEQAIRMSSKRPATEEIMARIEQRREDLLQQHATCKLETQKHIARTRAAAAEDRCGIQAEAAELLSKGDLHEFSNFLAKNMTKTMKYRRVDYNSSAGSDGTGDSGYGITANTIPDAIGAPTRRVDRGGGRPGGSNIRKQRA